MCLLSELVDRSRLETGQLDADATALSDGSDSLTWSEYVERVARLSTLLRDAGVVPGDRVGVRLAKSCESFVAVHAVVRAGAVMVPLDPAAPAGVAAAVIRDAGVEVLIGDRRTAGSVAELGPLRAMVLPGVVDRPVGAPGGPAIMVEADIAAATPSPRVEVAPDDPAYIIYTSGSTGRPKGIVHTHASALAYARAAADEYGLGADDHFANIAPLHFDQSTFELYAAPLVGGSVLVVPDPVLRFPASVTELIARERITVWYSVPFLLEQIATRGVLTDRDLSSLRWVLFGGESFPHRALADLMRQLPHASFSNVYGPAEVNQCTAHLVTEPPTGPVPIGRAWPAATIRLVDPDDASADVPDGAPGVIAVATPTMMHGYWNRPDLTAASTLVDGQRWYVTGDLARPDGDGNLVFLGRVDHQVKVRGYRIELEAVDAALAEAPGVAAATVVVDRPEVGEARLVAVVEVDRDDVGGDAAHDAAVVDAIAAFVRDRLPRYAVPAEIRVTTSLPRTSTGKVDRTAAKRLVDGTRERDADPAMMGDPPDSTLPAEVTT